MLLYQTAHSNNNITHQNNNNHHHHQNSSSPTDFHKKSYQRNNNTTIMMRNTTKAHHTPSSSISSTAGMAYDSEDTSLGSERGRGVSFDTITHVREYRRVVSGGQQQQQASSSPTPQQLYEQHPPPPQMNDSVEPVEIGWEYTEVQAPIVLEPSPRSILKRSYPPPQQQQQQQHPQQLQQPVWDHGTNLYSVLGGVITSDDIPPTRGAPTPGMHHHRRTVSVGTQDLLLHKRSPNSSGRKAYPSTRHHRQVSSPSSSSTFNPEHEAQLILSQLQRGKSNAKPKNNWY